MSETMTDTYWITTPGSTEPPIGPLTRAEVMRGWKAGRYPNVSQVCRTDETEWHPITILDTKPKKKRRARDAGHDQVAEETARDAIEGDYTNLITVSSATTSAGSLLKVLAALVAVAGLVGASQLGPLLHSVAPVVVVAALALGLLLYGAGVLLSAAGEALLALKDLTVSARLVADREG